MYIKSNIKLLSRTTDAEKNCAKFNFTKLQKMLPKKLPLCYLKHAGVPYNEAVRS